MTALAVIPARGGSKRILKKNIRPFCGKPMIEWVIDFALTSGFFEKVFVSTDSAEIAQLSVSLGAEVPFLRPENLSDGNTGLMDVIKHSIDFFEKKKFEFSSVTLLYPTAPFIRSEYLAQAMSDIEDNEFAVSVCLYPYPIQRALEINTVQKTIEMIDKDFYREGSQDLRKTYHEAGQFIVGQKMAWKTKTPFLDGRTSPVIIPRYLVQDIDEEEDWVEAEIKFSMLKKMNK